MHVVYPCCSDRSQHQSYSPSSVLGAPSSNTHTHNKMYTSEERTIMAAFRSISVLVFLPSVAYDSEMSTYRAHVLLTGQQQKMYMKIECLHIFIVSYFFTPPQNMMSRTKLKMITCNSTVAVVVWIERSVFFSASLLPSRTDGPSFCCCRCAYMGSTFIS